MRRRSRIRHLFRSAARRRAIERDIDEELRFHIERRTSDNVAAGMAPEAAAREAQMKFGHLPSVREECRDTRGSAAGEYLLKDARYGLRGLLGSPGFTTVAILSLALGIGATTTVFSLANAALFRPLPVKDPSTLVTIHQAGPGGSRLHVISYPDYEEYRRRAAPLVDLLAWCEAPVSLSLDGRAQQAYGIIVSGNYFPVLGIRAAAGRLLSVQDDRTPGAHPVAVLSFPFWQSRFGGDPDVVGKILKINGHAFTIVGVAPRGFTSTYGVFAPALYVPLAMQKEILSKPDLFVSRLSSYLKMSGRLASGVSREQARAVMNVIQRRLPEDDLQEEHPESETAGLELASIGSYPEDIRLGALGMAGLLLSIVGIVLLIACANVAGMQLARATKRRREMAVRLALGATRRRLIRQLLTESGVLFALSGALGAALAASLTRLISHAPLPAAAPFAVDARMDWRVLGFTLLLALSTSFVFGLAPALEAVRTDLQSVMKDAPALRGIRRSRWRQAFVIAQIALAGVLLIGAGLAARAVGKAQTLYPGRHPETVLTAGLDPHLLGYDAAHTQELYGKALERIAALPGVEAASLVRHLDVGGGFSRTSLAAEDARGESELQPDCNAIAPGFFRTMGITLLEGRDFTPADREGAPSVVIVSAALARRAWPGASALGRRVRIGEDAWAEIVGVVEDGPSRAAGEAPEPFVYWPFSQGSQVSDMTLVWRQRGPSLPAIEAVTREIEALDPDLPLASPMTLSAGVNEATVPWRAAGALASAFGLIGLALAVLGVYGVVSYTVGQRTQEIGVRVALGARRGDISRLVLAQGARLALVGVAIGVTLALGAMQALAALLFGVSPADLSTYAIVASLLIGVVLVACWLPARRAARLDPMVALRQG